MSDALSAFGGCGAYGSRFSDMKTLENKRVAILATDGFEQVELEQPRQALQEAGAITEIVSPKAGTIQGMHHAEKGEAFPVDVLLSRARPDDYDALLLPGGALNPDALRTNEQALAFVRNFFDQGKPVAAICHAAWILIDVGIVEGRTLTSWPAIATDVRNAGGIWVDQEVVVDNGLVTSRQPSDIPAFNAKMVEEIAEGIHAGR